MHLPGVCGVVKVVTDMHLSEVVDSVTVMARITVVFSICRRWGSLASPPFVPAAPQPVSGNGGTPLCWWGRAWEGKNRRRPATVESLWRLSVKNRRHHCQSTAVGEFWCLGGDVQSRVRTAVCQRRERWVALADVGGEPAAPLAGSGQGGVSVFGWGAG